MSIKVGDKEKALYLLIYCPFSLTAQGFDFMP